MPSPYDAHAIAAGERCLTVAGLLRRWLAWEWALWIAGCLWLLLRAGIAPGWTLAVAPASWLLTRWLVFVLELLLALTLRYRLPASLGSAMPAAAPPAGPLALLGCITVEWWHWLFNFVFGQAFAWRAPAPLPTHGRGPVVLLVHGFGCNATIWRHAAVRLADAGYRVAALDLLPVFGPIELYVEQLHARIEALCAEHGCDRLMTVGHSMGGIALRAYAARHGDARLARLVTLGSPHRGTWFAQLFLSPNVRQMRIGSDFLRELAEVEADRPAQDRICLWSRHDNVVTPQLSARLPGAREVAIERIGHLSLICTPRSIALLLAALAEPGQGSANAAHTATPSLRLTAM
ncbi:esterase/lipase family protein [Derxia lacustris]|uniref:esterase/lipase family protein n=1 Tax=Derxia lacustris TaxID=764842 RepID=UPI00159397D3|nr:alpha/beta fold hydrolase [Derxia lacustris]